MNIIVLNQACSELLNKTTSIVFHSPIILLMIVSAFLPFHLVAQENMMFPDGMKWHYSFKYSVPPVYYPDGEFALEYWMVDGSEVINEKEYQNLFRHGDFYQVKEMWRPTLDRNTINFKLSVREENGHVYAIKEQYLQFLRQLYPQDLHPDITPFYVAEAEDETEVLLYDFTLHEGDTYPCIGDVKVEEVLQQKTADGVKRKVLKLSNGVIVMEGVGCLNSIGGLIIYQNMEGLSETFQSGNSAYAYLVRCWQTDSRVDRYLNQTTAIRDLPSNQSRPTSNNLYDLSGRRLSTPPAKGILIQDGKKVVR